MANRNYKPGAMAIEKGTIKLYGRVVMGAAGAIDTQDCRGFSVSKDGTGVIQILLEDEYNDLYNCSTILQDVGFASDLSSYLSNVAVGVDPPTFDLVFHDGSGDTDPETGSTILIEITLKNSTVKY